MRRREAVRVVTLGSFSHTNGRVLEQLCARFSEFEIQHVDLATTRVMAAAVKARLAVGLIAGDPIKYLREPSRILADTIRTTAFFDETRAYLQGMPRDGRYAFSFQTQSVFDASIPGVPHFVYTDHTHLANLGFPGFHRSNLADDSWVARERSIYQNATATLTMSSHVTRSVVDDYGSAPGDVECVYVGSNAGYPEADEPAWGHHESQRVLFVGGEWLRKGGPCLVEAFRKVQSAVPGATLTVVGCKPKLDSSLKVEVLGRVPLAQVRRLYGSAAVFCLPTRIEPFGIACVEALAFGVPVVATRIGALPDFVIDDTTGYLVPPDDAASLADRLIRLLSDPDACRRLGRNGQQLVAQRYTWQGTGKRIEDAVRRRLDSAQA